MSACNISKKKKSERKRYDRFIADFDEAEHLITNEIIYAEAVRQLREKIEKLPPKCREITDKFIWEEKNFGEVAEELNVSVSTVNNQKTRAV